MKIRIIPTILLVLVIGLSLLIKLRWNAWFGNPPEPEYVTSLVPDRIILSLGEDTGTERYVSWRCDTVPRKGYVEVWNREKDDTVRVAARDTLIYSRAGKSVFYHALLKGLEPGTEYSYRVANEGKASDWYDFFVEGQRDTLAFITLGDIQDALGGETKGIFQDIHRHYPRVSFWAFGGDIIERPMDVYWSYWFDTMEGIVQSVPVVAATGNHEYLKGVVKRLDTRWTSTFKNPVNGPEGFEGRTYRLSFEDMDFITLDTDGLQSPMDYVRVRRWLDETLGRSDKKWKVVMMHHPVYSVRSGRDNPFIRWTFKPVFERHKVDLVLEGHDHGYSRIASRDGEDRPTTPVYIDSNCSPKLYPIGFDKIHDRLGSNLNFYQYITLKGDTLSVKVFTTEHEIYDDIAVVKDGAGQVNVYDNATHIPESLQLPDAYKKWKKKKLNEYERQRQERMVVRNY